MHSQLIPCYISKKTTRHGRASDAALLDMPSLFKASNMQPSQRFETLLLLLLARMSSFCFLSHVRTSLLFPLSPCGHSAFWPWQTSSLNPGRDITALSYDHIEDVVALPTCVSVQKALRMMWWMSSIESDVGVLECHPSLFPNECSTDQLSLGSMAAGGYIITWFKLISLDDRVSMYGTVVMRPCAYVLFYMAMCICSHSRLVSAPSCYCHVSWLVSSCSVLSLDNILSLFVQSPEFHNSEYRLQNWLNFKREQAYKTSSIIIQWPLY